MQTTSYGWCPECEQFTAHYGIKCSGCDMSDEEVEKAVKKESDLEPENTTNNVAPSRDWSKESWVVCENRNPVFAESQKKECSKRLASEFDVEDTSSTRYDSGLYYIDEGSVRYWIGRPDAYEENGFSFI